ncbi:MAG TPA: pyridoxamine 5'-phosphate oxidase family protein [Calditrichia bacterium]|nr:pyridoxamine 5'-phosphate oxidase family protein [Calditrichia bacterium]
MLNAEVLQSIRESVLCWLATASKAGEPNVSPKEMFCAFGEDKILIANIASPNSVANIAENPNVCVSFVDVFKQKGFKVKGMARIVRPEQTGYAEMLAALHQLGGEAFPIRNIIEVTVRRVNPIVAPSYWLFPETTEKNQIEQALRTYGVGRIPGEAHP